MPERVSELCADHLIIYDLRITRCELFRGELLPSVQSVACTGHGEGAENGHDDDQREGFACTGRFHCLDMPIEDVRAEIRCSEPDAVATDGNGNFLDRAVGLLMVEMEHIVLRLSGKVIGVFQADKYFTRYHLYMNIIFVLERNIIEGNIGRFGVKGFVVMLDRVENGFLGVGFYVADGEMNALTEWRSTPIPLMLIIVLSGYSTSLTPSTFSSCLKARS